MCSIFGYVARKSAPVRLDVLRDIIAANDPRGPHAFGFAWIDGRGTLRAYRQRGRLVDQLAILAIARDARMLIGHLRYATHGNPADNINNHPHPVDGGWLVHNGVVSNYDRLLDRLGLPTVSQCDSEVLGLLVERATAGTRGQRVRDAIKQTSGPLTMAGLWPRPAMLTLARRGNPLHYADGGAGVYFGSLARGLPGRVREVRDDQVITLRHTAGGLVTKSIDLPRSRVPGVRTLFDAATYRGG